MPERLMSARRPARALRSTSSSPRSRKQSMSKGSILVVDDESEIREGLELLLRGEGYGVSSAETGESGLEKLEQHPMIYSSWTSACRTATVSTCSRRFTAAIRSSPLC